LKGFYNQFSGASLDSVNKIDPFLTFECQIWFHPSVTEVQDVTKIEQRVDTEDYAGNKVEDESVEGTSTENVGDSSVDSVIG
jgi:hypothetical protein